MDTLMSDPLFVAMNDPTQSWGDLFVERERDDHLATVMLSSQQDITTHFPVEIVAMGNEKCAGNEQYAIVWREKYLQAWRDAHPSDYFGWKDHERSVERKLMRALQRSSTWTVTDDECATAICVIRRATPCLRTLNDIKSQYPVVWHKDPNNPNIYSIELYEKKIRQVARHLSYDVDTLIDRISARLSKALHASPAWRVLYPETAVEFARIEML